MVQAYRKLDSSMRGHVRKADMLRAYDPRVRKHATRNLQTCSTQTCNTQTCNLQHASMQHADMQRSDMQHATHARTDGRGTAAQTENRLRNAVGRVARTDAASGSAAHCRLRVW